MKNNEIKSKVQKQFSIHAEEYVKSKTHASGTDLKAIIDWLTPTQDWVVLDIATGGGHVTKALSPFVSHVFATDLTQQMLAAAKRHLSDYQNIWYVLADAEALPFLDETFEAVVCRIAAHHFPNPNSFVKEVSRVLKPGGKFLLIDNISPEDVELDEFINTMEKLRDDSHGRCFTITEWEKWFEEEGLKITKSEKRRKELQFSEWVTRTTKSPDDVVNHILSSKSRYLEYYEFKIEKGQIESFQLDEWMVMVEKRE